MKSRFAVLIAAVLGCSTLASAPAMSKPCLVPSGQPIPSDCDRGHQETPADYQARQRAYEQELRNEQECARRGGPCSKSAR